MASLAAVTATIASLGGTAYVSVSRVNIKKAMPGVSAARLNNTLKGAVASGKLVQDKGSYKLPKKGTGSAANNNATTGAGAAKPARKTGAGKKAAAKQPAACAFVPAPAKTKPPMAAAAAAGLAQAVHVSGSASVRLRTS